MLTTLTNEHYWVEGTLDWKDAILAWEETDRLEAQVQWRRGDIAVALRSSEDEGIEATLKAFADAVGVELITMQQYRQVAKAYQRYERSYLLSWTHYLG